jgi:hypothetical protein
LNAKNKKIIKAFSYPLRQSLLRHGVSTASLSAARQLTAISQFYESILEFCCKIFQEHSIFYS